MKSQNIETATCPQCHKTDNLDGGDLWCNDCQILIQNLYNNHFCFLKHLGQEHPTNINEFYDNVEPYIIWDCEMKTCEYNYIDNGPHKSDYNQHINLPYNTPYNITIHRIQQLIAFI